MPTDAHSAFCRQPPPHALRPRVLQRSCSQVPAGRGIPASSGRTREQTAAFRCVFVPRCCFPQRQRRAPSYSARVGPAVLPQKRCVYAASRTQCKPVDPAQMKTYRSWTSSCGGLNLRYRCASLLAGHSSRTHRSSTVSIQAAQTQTAAIQGIPCAVHQISRLRHRRQAQTTDCVGRPRSVRLYRHRRSPRRGLRGAAGP